MRNRRVLSSVLLTAALAAQSMSVVAAADPSRLTEVRDPRAAAVPDERFVSRIATGAHGVSDHSVPATIGAVTRDWRDRSVHDLTATAGRMYYEAIVLRPEDPTPPEELAKLKAMGPIRGAGDYPLTTLVDQYWRGGDPNEFYYLPRAFRLARDADGGYGMSAVWTGDRQILLTLTLRADIDPAEQGYARELVRAREGRPSARLAPLPYNSASIVNLEGLKDWLIADSIRVPSAGSLDGSIPLSITLSPESFATLKPLLETQGIGAGFEVVSGEQTNLIDIRIGLRDPSGHAYSPLQDIRIGFDPDASQLIVDGVRNNLEFPITIDRLDVEFNGEDWAARDAYAAIPVEPPITLEPSELGRVVAAFTPSDVFRERFDLASTPGRSGTDERPAERILRRLLEGVLEGRRAEAADTETAQRELWPLAAATRRYRLRFTPDFSCQSCFERIWSRLEVVSYIERQRHLQVEVLAGAFERDYGGRRLDTLKVDLKSPFFSPDSESFAGLHSVVLTRDHGKDDSVEIYLPSDGDGPLALDYRVSAYFTDGSNSVDERGWRRLEDSLQLLLTGLEVRGLPAEIH